MHPLTNIHCYSIQFNSIVNLSTSTKGPWVWTCRNHLTKYLRRSHLHTSNLPDDKLKVRQIYQLKQLSCLDKTTYISHLIYLTKYAFKRQLKVSVYRCTTNGGTVLVLISLREWDDNVSFSIFIFTIYIDSLIYSNQPCLLIIYQSAVYKCILLPVVYRVCTYESKFTGSGNFGWATP